MLGRPQDVDAELLGEGGHEGAAMGCRRPGVRIVVDLAGLPVDVLVGQPQVIDARRIEALQQSLAIGRDGAAAGLREGRRGRQQQSRQQETARQWGGAKHRSQL